MLTYNIFDINTSYAWGVNKQFLFNEKNVMCFAAGQRSNDGFPRNVLCRRLKTNGPASCFPIIRIRTFPCRSSIYEHEIVHRTFPNTDHYTHVRT